MSRYYLQGDQDASLKMPWPVLVSEDGRVMSGRPDAWALLGFQKGPYVQKINLTFEQAKADWNKIANMFPVYSGAFDEGIFVVLEKTTRAEVWGDNVYGHIRS